MLLSVPQGIKAIAHFEDSMLGPDEKKGEEDTRLRLEHAKEEAELAQKEIDTGFPLLHAQAVVSLWGSLEAFIRTFLAGWLKNEPSARQAEVIRKLRVRLWEYETMDEDERCLHTIELLEQELGASQRRGIERFETLLGVFGLSGDVDEETKKNLYEMYNVRNVLVHRRGIADRRLTDACPWLGVEVGDPVRVTHDALERYVESLNNYFVMLLLRIADHFGLPMQERLEKRRAEQGS